MDAVHLHGSKSGLCVIPEVSEAVPAQSNLIWGCFASWDDELPLLFKPLSIHGQNHSKWYI